MLFSQRSKHENGFATKQMTWSFGERASIRNSFEIQWREDEDMEGHGAIGGTKPWKYYDDSVASSSKAAYYTHVHFTSFSSD